MSTVLARLALVIYGLVTGSLLLMAMLFVVGAWWMVAKAALGGENVVEVMLRSIGLLVIALAVFDVAKFLWEEEIVRDKELRSATEARRTLTKFMTILVIAVSLEALVFIFDAGKDDVRTVVYPAILLAVVVLMLVGIAAHQRLMRSAEQMDPTADPDSEAIHREGDDIKDQADGDDAPVSPSSASPGHRA
ncbi:hypothetical protein HHL28_16240 [Aerophototrophica crusticola]|uniref:GNAT family acetyltransferase n=1 Tax=Aerophototrophica crusticola TaxID=1709002 RepID=A0A858RAC8_9PROT|nr:hypothetical protein HHL28_16240 [Rhodospirillaceae bacterium B3]